MKAPYTSLLFILFFSLSGLSSVQAQDEDDESEYTREFVWGINKNTNGGYIGGLNIKISRLLSEGIFRTYGFEMANVKHPKEARYPSTSGGTYILGKINYLYALRFSAGLEKVLFRKGPQQGVQINAIASAGPTIGLISPYYIEFGGRTSGSSQTLPYLDVYRNKQLNPGNIYGPGRPLQGLGESVFAPGLHVRGGVSFEFGTFKSNVSGLELGLMLEGYAKKVQLLAESPGQWFFPSAYITLFHGSRR